MKISNFTNASPTFTIVQTAASVQNFVRKLVDEKLSFLQSMIIVSIYFEKEKGPTPTELAEVLGSSKSAVSHAISELESLGLVKRMTPPADARKFRLSLNSKGTAIALKLVRAFDEVQRKIESSMGQSANDQLVRDVHLVRSFHDS